MGLEIELIPSSPYTNRFALTCAQTSAKVSFTAAGALICLAHLEVRWRRQVLFLKKMDKGDEGNKTKEKQRRFDVARLKYSSHHGK